MTKVGLKLMVRCHHVLHNSNNINGIEEKDIDVRLWRYFD